MSCFRLTSEAECDLNLIWDFIAQDNVDAANRVIDKIVHSMEMLSKMPEMAQKRPKLSEIYPDLRMWPVNEFSKYLVFYVPIEDGILVIRILHSSRNIDELI